MPGDQRKEVRATLPGLAVTSQFHLFKDYYRCHCQKRKARDRFSAATFLQGEYDHDYDRAF